MATIAITDSDLGPGDVEREVLAGHEVRLLGTRSPDQIVRGAADADGLLVQWAPIGPQVLDALPRLRAVVRYGIGLDNVDLDAARERGVRVANVPDYCIDEVAAHTVALVVTQARRICELSALTRAGTWDAGAVPLPLPPAADVVGVAGVGRIGSVVARQLRALGHPVLGWDPYATSWPPEVDRVPTLHELAERSSHLSLHLPLTEQTRAIVDAAVLRGLGPQGHLVNTSRGGLVDEDAVIAALLAGELGHASLDVLATEPPLGASRELLIAPRTTITPHAAYASTASRQTLQRRAAQIMAELLDGTSPGSP